MNKTIRQSLVPYTAVLLLAPLAATCAADSKPNIVIIFIDDMGYGDIGQFGATTQKTPQLDRMAREGIKFTHFYAAPVCSVSRAQMMTGCYGVRVSVPGVYSPASRYGLNPTEHTVAERLKEHGYATMCIGKWHLGDQPAFLPGKQGFDHYFGIPYSNDMQRKATQTGERVVPLVRDDQVLELLAEEGQCRLVERYTAEAIGFIREKKDNPFFLYLPHTAVHTPIHPGAAFGAEIDAWEKRAKPFHNYSIDAQIGPSPLTLTQEFAHMTRRDLLTGVLVRGILMFATAAAQIAPPAAPL